MDIVHFVYLRSLTHSYTFSIPPSWFPANGYLVWQTNGIPKGPSQDCKAGDSGQFIPSDSEVHLWDERRGAAWGRPLSWKRQTSEVNIPFLVLLFLQRFPVSLPLEANSQSAQPLYRYIDLHSQSKWIEMMKLQHMVSRILITTDGGRSRTEFLSPGLSHAVLLSGMAVGAWRPPGEAELCHREEQLTWLSCQAQLIWATRDSTGCESRGQGVAAGHQAPHSFLTQPTLLNGTCFIWMDSNLRKSSSALPFSFSRLISFPPDRLLWQSIHSSQALNAGLGLEVCYAAILRWHKSI